MAELSKTARDELVLAHVPLVRHIVGRMSVPKGLDRDDLYGYGMLGLLAAADTWDESRGLKFSTFAFNRVRGAILDELRRRDVVPRGQRARLRELAGAVAELEQALGLPPTPDEIALKLGTTTDDVDELLVLARSNVETSLDDGDETSPLRALVADPRCDDPAGSAEWAETKARLVEAIHSLPDAERTVILLYYAEERLLREIAEVLEVTESRVSQIHTRALCHLNRMLAARTAAREER